MWGRLWLSRSPTGPPLCGDPTFLSITASVFLAFPLTTRKSTVGRLLFLLFRLGLRHAPCGNEIYGFFVFREQRLATFHFMIFPSRVDKRPAAFLRIVLAAFAYRFIGRGLTSVLAASVEVFFRGGPMEIGGSGRCPSRAKMRLRASRAMSELWDVHVPEMMLLGGSSARTIMICSQFVCGAVPAVRIGSILLAVSEVARAHPFSSSRIRARRRNGFDADFRCYRASNVGNGAILGQWSGRLTTSQRGSIKHAMKPQRSMHAETQASLRAPRDCGRLGSQPQRRRRQRHFSQV